MATKVRNADGKSKNGSATSKSSTPHGLDSSSPNYGVIAGAAGAGVALGLLAALGRKVVVQAPTLMAGDWATALAAEHAATLKIFDALEKTDSSNPGKRTMLLGTLKHALAKHALQEENVIYPALRDSGETEAADSLNHDHGYVKQYLYDLETLPKTAPAFLVKLAEFRAAIEKHMHEEENDLFPTLRGKLSVEKNKTLTAMMNKEGFKLA